MLLTLFLSFAALTVGRVAASSILHTREPQITLPLTPHINISRGSLLKADRARLEGLRLYQSKDAPQRILLPARDSVVIYTTNISIGVPPTTYSLLIDTGSSNTWVGAGKPYQITPTSQETKDIVSVFYGSGSFTGMEYVDTLTVGTATITQSIGVAHFSEGFRDVDGVLGIGPTVLTLGTLFPDHNGKIPTVIDNLMSQYKISAKVIGISFEPPNIHTSPVNGQLDFGGTDSLKFTGRIHYTPITSNSPYNHYWGINQDIAYGHTNLTTSSPAIVDTGTTLLYLPEGAFRSYAEATGAVMDNSIGLLSVTPQQFHDLKSMYFTIGGVKYEFNANAQIWPRALNHQIGGSDGKIYLIVANGGSETISSINRFAWLQRFYSVFDTDKQRIGFANTPFTNVDTN